MAENNSIKDTALAKAGFQVGIELYGVRRQLEADFEGTLAKVAEIGYEYVEFYGHYAGKSASEVKAILDKLGLKCTAVHQGAQAFVDDANGKIAFLKELGVTYVAIPSWPVEKLRSGSEFAKTVYLFTAIAQKLKGNGIQLGYHNHDYEFERAEKDGPYLLDRLLRSVPGLDPEFDTCWIHYGGEDPVKYLTRYKGHVEVIHLKDFACKNLGAGPVYNLVDKDGRPTKPVSHNDSGFEYRPIGQGIQDITAILEAAAASGTVQVIVEQDETNPLDPIEAHRQSREYLKGLGI